MERMRAAVVQLPRLFAVCVGAEGAHWVPAGAQPWDFREKHPRSETVAPVPNAASRALAIASALPICEKGKGRPPGNLAGRRLPTAGTLNAGIAFVHGVPGACEGVGRFVDAAKQGATGPEAGRVGVVG